MSLNRGNLCWHLTLRLALQICDHLNVVRDVYCRWLDLFRDVVAAGGSPHWIRLDFRCHSPNVYLERVSSVDIQGVKCHERECAARDLGSSCLGVGHLCIVFVSCRL